MLEANRDAIFKLLEAESPIEIEDILGVRLPDEPEFADISKRVAQSVMDKIMLKLAYDSPLKKMEALYLGNCLVSMFELGADPSLAFNRPNRPGRRTDFARNIDITYQFCRLVASKIKPTEAYDELEEEFHLDRRQIIDIVKKNEQFVREYYPFADEPLWK